MSSQNAGSYQKRGYLYIMLTANNVCLNLVIFVQNSTHDTEN